MKTVSKSLCYIFVAALFTIALYHPSYASSKPLTAKEKAPYSVVVNKNLNSKKHKIRLYNDAGHQGILFTVNGIEGNNYQLFVFDMEGTLVTQVNVENRETTVLNNMAKGNYLFEVLIKDERIESGQLSIK
ncbi:MAG: T9SS type A sorting domain-containing protein [Bacteroidetes bacterium]|nr:T9SS type A sorting domain-containing protein [Bacteroidota bacterium]